MGTTENVFAISERLRREDCRRTKHDSAFSEWKILIGTPDWEGHAQGKEGAEKYRIENLPKCTSCPGVYEFGIVLSRSGRETRKLDPESIIPVYLGKSDNVRNRLQQYGRDGSHLENDCKNILNGEGRGPRLFSEIFAKGFSIVYRWAPMTNPREAKKTEAKLLGKFDYAWNRGRNGSRRQNEILKIIDRNLKSPQFIQRRKGIKIKACSRPLLEDAYNFYSDFLPNNFPAGVLKFGRSRPIFVSWKSSIDEYCPSICGVDLGHGVVCRKPQSEGRRRCAEHKGMKINATSSRLVEERKFTLAADKHPVEMDFVPGYGVILRGGSSCTTEPIQGNKISLEHKGCQIHDTSPQSLQVKKEYAHGEILDCIDNKSKLPEKGGKLNPSSGEQVSLRDGNTICGIDLEDGTFCTRQPPRGRMRCEEHKGIRVKMAGSKFSTEKVYCEFDSSVSKSCSREEEKNHAFLSSVFSDKSSPTCGMTLQNGRFCSRIPVEGNKRCWQHKGMKVEKNHMFPSIMDDNFSPTCNAALSNGSFCTRNPTDGNKRCWQHKGMRVDANSGSSTAPTISLFGSVNEDRSQTCGAPLHNGSYCRRRSSGRCWQHKVDASSGNSTYNSHYHRTASRYSSHDSLCGAPLRNGSYCSRRSSGPCWQHRG